jgi:hypothetical protein
MNPVFVSALKSHGGPGAAIRTASGTIPARVHPPAEAFPQTSVASLFSIGSPEAKPVQVRVASAAPSSSGIGAFFGNLFGSKREDAKSDARESVTQSVQTKSQALLVNASASAAQSKTIATTKDTSESRPPNSPSRNHKLRLGSKNRALSRHRVLEVRGPPIFSSGLCPQCQPELSTVGSARGIKPGWSPPGRSYPLGSRIDPGRGWGACLALALAFYCGPCCTLRPRGSARRRPPLRVGQH